MEILIEEQVLTKYYVIKHLILPKIHILMDFNVDLLQLFIKFLTKRTSGGVAKNEIKQKQ